MNHFEQFEVGMLVYAYHKGLHRITKIVGRANNSPLFHYTKEFNEDGAPSRKLKNTCDASYCRPAKDYLQTQIAELEESLKNLKRILNESA